VDSLSQEWVCYERRLEDSLVPIWKFLHCCRKWVDLNGEAKTKVCHLWPVGFQQECQKKELSVQKAMLKQLDIHMQKNEFEPLPPTNTKT
jgi:hypothetical protein